MTKTVSLKELRAMQVSDLQEELKQQEMLVAKLRMGVKLQKEKDSAKYRREKKQRARMKTIMAEKRTEQLPGTSRPTPLSAAPKRTTKRSRTKA